MDRLTRKERSANMARIRGKDTTPEVCLRRELHSLGLRYRLHARDLPGSPDIILRPSRLAVFVHGCFWHRHEGCKLTTTPKTNELFWQEKFARNVARDTAVQAELTKLGWESIVVWECQTKDQNQLSRVAAHIAFQARVRRCRGAEPANSAVA